MCAHLYVVNKQIISKWICLQLTIIMQLNPNLLRLNKIPLALLKDENLWFHKLVQHSVPFHQYADLDQFKLPQFNGLFSGRIMTRGNPQILTSQAKETISMDYPSFGISLAKITYVWKVGIQFLASITWRNFIHKSGPQSLNRPSMMTVHAISSGFQW